MNLVDLCEPVFQYICRLNRMGRKEGRADADKVRADLKQLMAELRQRADKEPGMSGIYTQVEPVLTFFIDSMIMNCNVPFAAAWKPFSHDRGELGFEEKFWDMLEETLRDTSESATQRLAVFYVCIGLGFTGLYTGQPDYIRRKMLEISTRIRPMIDSDQAARITPDAYDHVDTRNLTRPPGRSLTGLGIAVGALAAVLVVAFVVLFQKAAEELETSLSHIKSLDSK